MANIEEILEILLEEDREREQDRVKNKQTRKIEKHYRQAKYKRSPNDSYWRFPYCETKDDKGVTYIKKYKMTTSKPYRKRASRKVRRYNGEIAKGGNYRKVREVWWDIY